MKLYTPVLTERNSHLFVPSTVRKPTSFVANETSFLTNALLPDETIDYGEIIQTAQVYLKPGIMDYTDTVDPNKCIVDYVLVQRPGRDVDEIKITDSSNVVLRYVNNNICVIETKGTFNVESDKEPLLYRYSIKLNIHLNTNTNTGYVCTSVFELEHVFSRGPDDEEIIKNLLKLFKVVGYGMKIGLLNNNI